MPDIMSNLKNKTINHILEIEGEKYTNDPDDSGGPTKWGITEAVARLYGYEGDMRDLSRELAFELLASKYWDSLKLTIIEQLSAKVAAEVADTSVNQGVLRAAKFLQRSLTVLNNKGKLYPDLFVDGQIGQKTIRALSDYLAYRGAEGEIVLLRMLNSLQGAFYVELAERREKDEKYIYGWFKDRVGL